MKASISTAAALALLLGGTTLVYAQDNNTIKDGTANPDVSIQDKVQDGTVVKKGANLPEGNTEATQNPPASIQDKVQDEALVEGGSASTGAGAGTEAPASTVKNPPVDLQDKQKSTTGQ